MSEGILEVANAGKTFGGLVAVNDITMSVHGGEIVGLVGPNGAGKTTLFELISGYIAASGGTFRLDGKDIGALAPHERARLGMGRTFQIVQPFVHMTVFENVYVGGIGVGHPPGDVRDHVAEVLQLVGLTGRIKAKAGALTLPEKKRLELARALATRPRVLLLDEVMAGLTPTEVEEMIDVLRGLKADGMSILIVEHVMRAIMALSDRIVVMANGSKIAEGPPARIASDEKVIEAYLGRGRAK